MSETLHRHDLEVSEKQQKIEHNVQEMNDIIRWIIIAEQEYTNENGVYDLKEYLLHIIDEIKKCKDCTLFHAWFQECKFNDETLSTLSEYEIYHLFSEFLQSDFMSYKNNGNTYSYFFDFSDQQSSIKKARFIGYTEQRHTWTLESFIKKTTNTPLTLQDRNVPIFDVSLSTVQWTSTWNNIYYNQKQANNPNIIIKHDWFITNELRHARSRKSICYSLMHMYPWKNPFHVTTRINGTTYTYQQIDEICSDSVSMMIQNDARQFPVSNLLWLINQLRSQSNGKEIASDKVQLFNYASSTSTHKWYALQTFQTYQILEEIIWKDEVIVLLDQALSLSREFTMEDLRSVVSNLAAKKQNIWSLFTTAYVRKSQSYLASFLHEHNVTLE